MTFSPNANWLAKTNAGALEPIYFIKFDGFNAFDFATAEVDFPQSAKKILLDNPSAVGQRLQQLTGRSSLSLITFGLVDRDGFITELISTEKGAPFLSTLVNRKVTLFGGYRGLRESDYEVIGVGQIASVELAENNTTFKFKMVDFKRNLAEDIMLNANASSRRIATRFDGAVAVGATNFLLDDVDKINEDDFLMLGPNSNGDEERVKIGFVDEVTRRVTLEAEPVQNVTQFPYADSDEVRWATTIVRGNPLNMVARFLTGIFKPAAEDISEVLFVAQFPLTKIQGLPTGLGISESQIDVRKLISERDLHLADEIWSFEFRSKTRGFRFLEQSIYRLLGYSHITIDGEISFRRYRPPTPKEILVDGLTTIKENDMIRWRWERAHDLHLNKVSLGLDFDTDDSKVSQTIVTEDTDDQTDTAETKEIEIEDTGLRAPDGGARIGDRIGGELLRRYKKPPIQIKTTVPLRLRAIEIGRDIEVSHELIPNITTGFRGLLDQRLEVVERTDRIDKDEIDLVLQFNGMVRPAFWAPAVGENREDGVAFDGTYATATDKDKEYAYWGDESLDVFPDGKPLFEWV